MSDIAIAHVEAAIRHRNLSLRVLVGLMFAGAVFAFVVAAVDLWSAEQAVTIATASKSAAQPGWPDLATKALGHFAFAFLIAALMPRTWPVMRSLIARPAASSAALLIRDPDASLFMVLLRRSVV